MHPSDQLPDEHQDTTSGDSAIVTPRWSVAALCALVALAPMAITFIRGESYWATATRPVLLVQLALGLGIIGLAALRWNSLDLRATPTVLRLAGAAMALAVWVSALSSADPTVGAAGAFTAMGFVVTVLAVAIVTQTPSDVASLLWWLVIGAVAAASVALVAMAFGGDPWFTDRFHGEVTRLGLRNRLTLPWPHANVAAMALATAAAVAVSLPRRTPVAVACSSVLIVALGLTYSRAGAAAFIAALGLATLFDGRRIALRAAWCTALLAALVALAPGWSGRDDANTQAFAAEVHAPSSIAVDGTTTVSIAVENTSDRRWAATGPNPVELSARWLLVDEAAEDRLVVFEQRWPLASDIEPGDSQSFELDVEPELPDGSYVVLWDVLLDGEAYFLQFTGRSEESDAVIAGSGVVDEALAGTPLVSPLAELSRRGVWDVSWPVFTAEPLFGTGPLQVGTTVSADLDPEVRFPGTSAHNLLLEPLAAWGLLATSAFAVIVVGGCLAAWRSRRRESSPILTAIAAGLAATVVHSIVEWPIDHVGAALPFAVLLGLAWSGSAHHSTSATRPASNGLRINERSDIPSP